MFVCKSCGNRFPEVIPTPMPPRHCPLCGAPAVIRTLPSEDESGTPPTSG